MPDMNFAYALARPATRQLFVQVTHRQDHVSYAAVPYENVRSSHPFPPVVHRSGPKVFLEVRFGATKVRARIARPHFPVLDLICRKTVAFRHQQSSHGVVRCFAFSIASRIAFVCSGVGPLSRSSKNATQSSWLRGRTCRSVIGMPPRYCAIFVAWRAGMHSAPPTNPVLGTGSRT